MDRPVAIVGLMVVIPALFVSPSAGFTISTEPNWGGRFEGTVLYNNTRADLIGWNMHFVFDQPILTFFTFTGMYEFVSDNEVVLGNWTENYSVKKGESLKIIFMGLANDTNANETIVPDVCIFIEQFGNDDCDGSVIPVTTLPNSTSKDYADALSKSIMFYNAQRSGKLPPVYPNNSLYWRGDSALNDCVVGGWYDGGDHMKFNFPMAYATMVLLWGLNKFKAGYEQAGQLDPMYDMVAWPLDYLQRTWNPFTQELVVQIGEATTDHAYWGRPEDMSMDRPCFKVGPSAPGSDVAAQTAAALALGAIVFRDKGDEDSARKMLQSAESIYKFAAAYRGLYTDVVTDARRYYRSTGDRDELCLAAMWLYNATGQADYLHDAQSVLQNNIAWSVDWNDKKVLCQVLLYEVTGDTRFRQTVEGFVRGWLPGTNHLDTYTPCGLAWFQEHGSNRYAANVAFVALLAANAGIESDTYRQWALTQINYMLGDNNANGGCFSFQIGHGHQYPRFPHHRASSCPDWPEPCDATSLNSTEPNPNLLVGALVGGPSSDDSYSDVRSDNIHNGVALDFNAGFQSALAGIVQLEAEGNLPVANNTCRCSD